MSISKHLLDFVLHLLVLFTGLLETISARCFNSTSFTIWRSLSPFEPFLQLLCRAGCNADDILRCSIFVVAQPDGEVPLSNIHDDSGSDEQIAALCLALFHLNQSAEWFAFGAVLSHPPSASWLRCCRYLPRVPPRKAVLCSWAVFCFFLLPGCNLPEKGTKDSRQVGSLKIL